MVIDEFVVYLKAEQNRAPLTAEAYQNDVTQFANWLTVFNIDKFNPADVTTSDIRAWLASLARDGMMPPTLRRKAQSIRAFFRYLLKRGVIGVNPTRDLTLPKISKNLPDFVRQEEMEGILRVEETEIEERNTDEEEALRTHLIVELLYSLGLRRAELISLHDNDINIFSKEIKVTGKRRKQRVVPLPDKLLEDIRTWQALRDSLWPDLPHPRPLLVVKGKEISASQVYSRVKKELAATGARKKSPHALRHSFATAMLNDGADINTVKEFLGHASLATTQIYTHVSFAEMKAAYNLAHPRAKK